MCLHNVGNSIGRKKKFTCKLTNDFFVAEVFKISVIVIPCKEALIAFYDQLIAPALQGRRSQSLAVDYLFKCLLSTHKKYLGEQK